MHKYNEPNHIEDYLYDLARFFRKILLKYAE